MTRRNEAPPRAPLSMLAGFAMVLMACGGRVASEGGEGSEGSAEDTGALADLPGAADLPPDPPAQEDCAPGTTPFVELSDICVSGCVPLPASCGDAPSCDAACNWDLCHTVACEGEQTVDCWGDAGPLSGWVCQFSTLCNVWLQDCPAGEKCRAYSPTHSWWTTIGCVFEDPIAAKVGEPCERSGGIYAGLDSCERGAVCWDVDPLTNLGTCAALCDGAPHDPICPEGSACVLVDPMRAAFCLEPCDPLAPDPCTPGYVCTLVADALACLPAQAAPAAVAEPCERPSDCAAGLACVPGERLPACVGAACCTPFCELEQLGAGCPAQAPSCAPALSDAPPGSAHVGVCVEQG